MTDLELVQRRGAKLRRLQRTSSRGHAARTRYTPRLLRRLLVAADALAVSCAAAILALTNVTLAAAASVTLLAPVWIVLAKLFGLYDRSKGALRHLAADELKALSLWALTCTGLLAIFREALPTGQFKPTVALLYWLTLLGAALLLRSGARLVWRRITPPARTVIFGSGPLAEAARRKLQIFPDIHVELLGNRELAPHELESFCGQLNEIDRVIVASDTLDEALLARLLRSCKLHRTRLSVIPPVPSVFGGAVALTRVAELPVVEHDTAGIGDSTLALKRAVDVAAAVVGLVLLAPVMAAIGLALRASSPGPALFSQVRAGQHGKPFRMLKFRTMVADAEARLADLISVDELPEPVFKLRDDPRVTRLGRILRRTSLDELPQLLNVLRGEMSLVGPRPEQLDLVERYSPSQRIRLEVKPGITGPMQVYGRGELTLDERLAVERDYIDNLSLGRDVQILALTVSAVFTGRGAL